MCPTCKKVLKGVCGRINCRNENGQKPCVILAACNRVSAKKTLSHTQQILAVKGVGGLSGSIEKGKFATKIFYPDNIEWSSKNLWKMMSTDVKANKNNKK